jgi:hypothetical protein
MRLHKWEDFGDALVLPINGIEREFEPLQALPAHGCWLAPSADC